MEKGKFEILKSFPVRIFSAITGALSLFLVIDELTFVQVNGKLSKWIEAYDVLIDRVLHPFFDFISYLNLEIDEVEAHLFVIFSIICGAAGMAFYRKKRDKYNAKKMNAIVTSVISAALRLIVFTVFTGLVERNNSIIVYVIATLMTIGWKYPANFAPNATEVRAQLLWIVLFFALIVFLNYTIFDWIDALS